MAYDPSVAPYGVTAPKGKQWGMYNDPEGGTSYGWVDAMNALANGAAPGGSNSRATTRQGNETYSPFPDGDFVPAVQPQNPANYAPPGSGGAAGSPSGGNYTAPAGNGGIRTPQSLLYPLDDPMTAIGNYLRSNGSYGNPYNPAYMRMLKYYAGVAQPMFAEKALGGGYDPTGDMGTQFSDFIGNLLSGQQPLQNYSQAAQGLGDINSLLRQNAAGGVGLSPLQKAIAGLYSTPEAQSQLYGSAYLGALGPALTSGLMRAQQPVEDRYSQWQAYQDANDPNRKFYSLLDYLLGSA